MWLFISRNLALLTLAAAISAFIYPPAFLIFKDYFLYFFATTMLALGIVLKPEEARTALNKPSTIVLGVLTQYSVMPLLGFAAASLAVSQGVSPTLALGFIIVGCAPGAMASNVITSLCISKVGFYKVSYAIIGASICRKKLIHTHDFQLPFNQKGIQLLDNPKQAISTLKNITCCWSNPSMTMA